ncbi:MAG: hypothetical protein U9O65_05715 [Thermotogota bacterium]|nr:hypothetical protein [Thermotogota bacterium]
MSNFANYTIVIVISLNSLHGKKLNWRYLYEQKESFINYHYYLLILSLSTGAFSSKNFVEEKFFLTLENRTIIKMTEEGTALTGIEAHEFCTDDASKLLFTLTEAYNYSSGEFELVWTFDSLKGYIFAGYGKIASVHNDTDDVDFYDYEGKFIKKIKFTEISDNHLQYISGIFLDDNTFLLSEDGNSNIVKINISEESCEVFKPFDIGWLGEITVNDYHILVLPQRC